MEDFTEQRVSIDWFKGKITCDISWENLWFPVDFPLSRPIDSGSPAAGYRYGYLPLLCQESWFPALAVDMIFTYPR